jgi:hypothetical protein|tara:strand:- start:344 stop:541 length:198 start_codon:yes stop_codon:yes gene_type:complete
MRIYTTLKEPMFPPSVKWIINQLSKVESDLKNKELKRVDEYLKRDLKQVLGELNITINQLLKGIN